MNPKHIVIAILGSLGDLHPGLALAVELKKRGYHVTVASSPCRRANIEELGLGFHSMRPHWDDAEIVRLCGKMRKGPEVVLRKVLLPELRGTYEDLLPIAANCDLIISHEIVFAVPLVAEKLGLPWVSLILSPSSFYSAYDPSVLVFAPELIHLRKAGLTINRTLINMGRFASKHWCAPVRQLRKELGLREKCEPLFVDKYSPNLVLALFSRFLAESQPDWPRQTVQPGFTFYDREASHAGSSEELNAFLENGEPPIVFTLGSLVVHGQGNFAEISVEAAKLLGRRAILVLGSGAAVIRSSENILAVPYLPYSQVFFRAAAIAHHGGIGTVAQVMRAGRPMLIVPFGWDQPDNAERVQRLGIGLHLPRKHYSVTNVAAALKKLLSEPDFAQRAEDMGAKVRKEDGVVAACDAVNSVLESRVRSSEREQAAAEVLQQQSGDPDRQPGRRYGFLWRQ